jgi:hypothetical protein
MKAQRRIGREGTGGSARTPLAALQPALFARPSTCARRNSSSIRAIPRAKASRSSEPVLSGSHSFLPKKKIVGAKFANRFSAISVGIYGALGNTHQMSRKRWVSSRDLSHILRTRRPSSLASGAGSGPCAACVDVGAAAMSRSMDRPRQPAFWRCGVGAGGGSFCDLRACARTFATKRTSYRARVASACCFAPVTEDAAPNETDAREDVEVREVVVPCESMEERSEVVVAVDWTEVRAEGGRERSGG